MHTYHST